MLSPTRLWSPEVCLRVGGLGSLCAPRRGGSLTSSPCVYGTAGLPGSQSISPAPISIARAFPACLHLPLPSGRLCWAGHLLQGALLSMITAETQFQVQGQDLI